MLAILPIMVAFNPLPGLRYLAKSVAILWHKKSICVRRLPAAPLIINGLGQLGLTDEKYEKVS
jgi:hypothetical protein